MKKILLYLSLLLFIIACDFNVEHNAKEMAKLYLNNYISLDEDIIQELEASVELEELTNNQKETYLRIIKNQYKNLKYEVLEENYIDEEAIIKFKITVIDLYTPQKEAEIYLNDLDEEMTIEAFNTYKLELMEASITKVDYIIDIKLHKEDNTWVVKPLDQDTLEKIHGIYTFET